MKLIAPSILASLFTGILAILAEMLLGGILFDHKIIISLGLLLLCFEVFLILTLAWAKYSAPEHWRSCFYTAAIASVVGSFTGVWPAPTGMFSFVLFGLGASMFGLIIAKRIT
jgi:hypothetical protein